MNHLVSEDDYRVLILSEIISRLKWLNDNHHFKETDRTEIDKILSSLELVKRGMLNDDEYNHM